MVNLNLTAEEVEAEEEIEEEAPPSALKVGDKVRMYPLAAHWRDGVVERINADVNTAAIRNDMGIIENCYISILVKKV